MYLVISKNNKIKNRYGLLSDDLYLVNNIKISSSDDNCNNNFDDNNNKLRKLIPKINTLSKKYIPFEKWRADNDFYIYMMTNDIINQINQIKLDDLCIYINEDGIQENIAKMLYKLSNNRYK